MHPLTDIFFVFAVLLAFAWWRERKRRHSAQARHQAELAEQRARREEELRGQSARTSALFDRMVEGVIVVDATGRIRLANKSAGALFDFSPAGAVGRSLLEATRHHDVSAVAARLDEQADVLGYELRIEGVDSTRFLQINALALRDAQGGRDGAILVFHDLTRLRQLESVRQDFVANVSHELRTPLSLIKSAAETLLDGGKEDTAALVRFLEIIDRHANRLTLLIDDLLLLSTLDSGRLRLAIEGVLLHAAAGEVLEDYESRAHARDVELVNAVPADLGARADPERLRQVLSNLVDNAIKYGNAGGRVTVTGAPKGSRFVEMSVQDDGPGLSLDAQARVFERFYRVDKARSREQGGTGLGLAIVKHVVQAHGGEVRVTSAPGAGATFSFSLPAM